MAAGFEPEDEMAQVVCNEKVWVEGEFCYPQIDLHEMGSSCPVLVEIVSAWDRLPGDVREAVRVLVSRYGN